MFLWIADILAKSLFISPPLGYIIDGRVMYHERRRPLRDTLVGDGYIIILTTRLVMAMLLVIVLMTMMIMTVMMIEIARKLQYYNVLPV